MAPGNLVGRGEATLLATVSRLDPLRVYLSVSEADYLRFQASRKKGHARPEAPIELLLADGTVFPHKGRFIIADRAIDLATGTLSIVAEFPNPDMLVRPGQFGRALVAVEDRPDAILVPQRAVQEVQGHFGADGGDRVLSDDWRIRGRHQHLPAQLWIALCPPETMG